MKVYLFHLISLFYATLFKTFYWAAGSNAILTVFFLEKYKNARRKIPGGYDPEKGCSTRYGASEAHDATQSQ